MQQFISNTSKGEEKNQPTSTQKKGVLINRWLNKIGKILNTPQLSKYK